MTRSVYFLFLFRRAVRRRPWCIAEVTSSHALYFKYVLVGVFRSFLLQQHRSIFYLNNKTAGVKITHVTTVFTTPKILLESGASWRQTQKSATSCEISNAVQCSIAVRHRLRLPHHKRGAPQYCRRVVDHVKPAVVFLVQTF